MNQLDRLTYCNYCENRLFDTNKGIVCKLTNEKAKFTNRCIDFKKDIEEIDKARRGSGAYRKIAEKNTHYIFPYLSKEEESNFRVEYLKLHNKLLKSSEFSTLMIFGIFGPPVVLGIMKMSVEIIIGTIASIMIVGSLYLIRKFKETPTLFIDENGFLIGSKRLIEWENIIRYYFESFKDENKSNPLLTKTYKTLIIEVFGEAKEIRVDITGCGGNMYKLGKKIEKLKKN
jgi:hypothetical protein